MITDGLIIALICSAILSLAAWKKSSLPLAFVASLGWLISALQLYQQTAELLPMALMLMISFSNFILINREA